MNYHNVLNITQKKISDIELISSNIGLLSLMLSDLANKETPLPYPSIKDPIYQKQIFNIYENGIKVFYIVYGEDATRNLIISRIHWSQVKDPKELTKTLLIQTLQDIEIDLKLFLYNKDLLTIKPFMTLLKFMSNEYLSESARA